MQYGLHSDADPRSETHVLPASGGLSTGDHVKGAQDGGGPRPTLVWSSAAGQRRSHRCSGSSATGLQTYVGSGLILRVRPRSPEWMAWTDLGPGVRYRDYELGLAQHLPPAQLAAGRGGPA